MRKNSKTRIVAITGTNGKSTTVKKIEELLNFSGIKSVAAGNIGVPYSKVVLENEYEYIVLELSSYQLENIRNFKPEIAGIINLSPDHLDRYENVEEYYLAKFNITKNQDSRDIFILNIDDENIILHKDRIRGKIEEISLKEKANIYVYNDKLWHNNEEIISIDEISLKGKHNLQNVLFIIEVAKKIGISNTYVRNFLRIAKNLEHRMEEFLRYKENNIELKFINDSKGTNLESTIKAIGAFENPILICGGCDKKLDLTPLIDEISKSVEEVYLIGELANTLEEKLLKNGYPKEKIYNLVTLDEVIENIYKNRGKFNKDTTILLSPGTASFDQFKNFEVRGREFKRLVRKKFKNN
jgi:UDP-N-acetylmuramoylalanine--D-glutamate ligase